jgi:hypothetical protein
MPRAETSSRFDRVVERRRTVVLARHYRERERLSIRQIADRLDRSPATIKAYFYDHWPGCPAPRAGLGF